MKKWVLFACTVFGAVSCTTSPGGRKQLIMVPDAQMNAMGGEAFSQILRKTPQSRDPRVTAYVRCITNQIVRHMNAPNMPSSWQVVVFEDKSANAFALPGGKVGVHTGLLKVARNQSQLATVIGHEIAHVIARHGNERYSQNLATNLAAQLALPKDKEESFYASLAMGVVQMGVILPYSRAHESEADILGLEYMANAGFDPRESVRLWRNMAASGGGRPPEFLSTHPAEQTRINQLNANMNQALQLYQNAQASGRRPKCG